MAFGMFPLMFLFFFTGTQATEMPLDLLGVLDPGRGLALLEKQTDKESLEKLIQVSEGAGVADVLKVPRKEVEKAIENLASSSEGLRSRARDRLVEAGPAVKKLLEVVVADDPRRAKEAKKVLAILAGEEAALRHEADVARILAIRFAANQKMAALVPAINGAASSKNPFVKLAAEDALVRLGERPKPSVAAGAITGFEDGLKEVEALPKETRLLVSTRLNLPLPGGTQGMTIDSMFQSMSKSLPIPPDQINQGVEEGSREMLKFVRTFGNLRPERAYIANVGTIDENGAGLGIILQGLYQPGVMRKAFTGAEWQSSEVEGVTVYKSREVSIALLSDRSVLLLPGEASLRFPLEEYLKNLAAGTKALRGSPKFAQFLTRLGSPDQVRALAVTDETLLGALYQEMEVDPGTPEDVTKAVRGLQEVELTVSALEDGKARIRFEGTFKSEEHSKALTGFLDSQIKAGVAEMEQAAQNLPVPFLTKWVEIMKGITTVSEGKKGILRLEMPSLKLEELMGGFGMSVRSAAPVVK